MDAHTVPIRRFQPADIRQHDWIVERLIAAFPHQTRFSLPGWLQNIVFANEFLFLFQEHAVALAEITSEFSLSGDKVVIERFVFAEKGHEAEAAQFYTEFHRWAASHGVKTIVVQEMSDVPHEMIKERLGRIFTRQQQFARV